VGGAVEVRDEEDDEIARGEEEEEAVADDRTEESEGERVTARDVEDGVDAADGLAAVVR